MQARIFPKIIRRFRDVAGALPDSRKGKNTRYTMADIALSAFSVFFIQCPSFLSFQRAMEEARGRNNARSLFEVERIPSDNHIRQTLDPVEPSHLFALFDELHTGFEQAGLLESMRAVGNTRLIAMDATWYFSSQSKSIHFQIQPDKVRSLRLPDDLHVGKFHPSVSPVKAWEANNAEVATKLRAIRVPHLKNRGLSLLGLFISKSRSQVPPGHSICKGIRTAKNGVWELSPFLLEYGLDSTLPVRL